MSLSNTPISELNLLTKINSLGERYEERFGSPPERISHWDPSPQLSSRLLPLLDVTVIDDPIRYIYSEDQNIVHSLLHALSLDPLKKSGLLVHNGTSAMLCAETYLRLKGLEGLVVTCPSYYPIYYAGKNFTRFDRVDLSRTNGRFTLPPGIPEALPSNVALWLTSPVYSTGSYIADLEILKLDRFLKRGGTLVADECLARSHRLLARRLGHHEGFIGLYCPHKSICVNGFKFAFVAAPINDGCTLQQISDVTVGGLNVATLCAVRHFLSRSFADYENAFILQIEHERLEFLKNINDIPNLELDAEADGHFLTVYFPAIAAEMSDSIDFLWRAMAASGSLFIPGKRNHFGVGCGFCFRLNLARGGPAFHGAVVRLCRYLSTL
jgi:hypothetical protein